MLPLRFSGCYTLRHELPQKADALSASAKKELLSEIRYWTQRALSNRDGDAYRPTTVLYHYPDDAWEPRVWRTFPDAQWDASRNPWQAVVLVDDEYGADASQYERSKAQLLERYAQNTLWEDPAQLESFRMEFQALHDRFTQNTAELVFQLEDFDQDPLNLGQTDSVLLSRFRIMDGTVCRYRLGL